MAKLMIVDGVPVSMSSLAGDAAEQQFLDAAMSCCNDLKCCGAGQQWNNVAAAWASMTMADRADMRARTINGPMVDVAMFDRLQKAAPVPPPKPKLNPPNLVVHNLSKNAPNYAALVASGRATPKPAKKQPGAGNKSSGDTLTPGAGNKSSGDTLPRDQPPTEEPPTIAAPPPDNTLLYGAIGSGVVAVAVAVWLVLRKQQ